MFLKICLFAPSIAVLNKYYKKNNVDLDKSVLNLS